VSKDLTLTSPALTSLLARLSLEEKVQLLTGRDAWTTWPMGTIGLRRMLLSDGPAGVRGEVWDERDPSLNLPSGTALASSWDVALARRYGNIAATEARRKGVDVVLGPTINLHRSPLGGRHFEAFSEDPVLTADLAAAYVQGVQERGVAATPKHYVANDYETDRYTASTEVSERALRELYLLAFEKAVTEAHAWLVMSAYNAVNGVLATEHELLETPLNTEWGFDGVVVSDWTAARSLAAAAASQDLVMPGPNGPWGAALVQAVRDGRISEAAVDRKVLRLLLLAARVGALDSVPRAGQAPAIEDGIAFARQSAAEGSVLLANDGLLPLSPDLRKVAVVGHNARQARTQGGGSATVVPEHVVSPLDGLRRALPRAEITYSLGAVVQHGLAEFPLDQIVNPATGTAGALVRFLDADGTELFREDRRATGLYYLGGDAPIGTAATVEISFTWTPAATEQVRLGAATVGHVRIVVDGELLAEQITKAEGGDLADAFLSPPVASAAVAAQAGTPRDVRITLDLTARDTSLFASALTMIAGLEPAAVDQAALIADAVRAARDADVAVVVVGTNSQVESEGHDRSSLSLPGHQDDLVRAVAATGTPTVVVVNSGAAVLLPWRDQVNAVLLTYFGGQEMGNAVADILLGTTEPGGRLPTTWPSRQEDVPVLAVTPVDGKLHYDEDIHIGYRAWLKSDADPAYPFGHGLGYTSWSLHNLRVRQHAGPHRDAEIEVTVRNDGDRAGKQVVQVYLARPDSSIDRPVRWLAAFAPVRLAAGETTTLTLPVPTRAFADWQPGGWHYEPGPFTVLAGTSVLDLPLAATIDFRDDESTPTP
jgi:beta-glucosidase